MTAFSPAGSGYNAGHYESPESRGLGTITIEAYQKVYDDQGKFMSKLASDNSYMAAMMRKMQAGIDQANENFIQQIQDLINNIIVILGGGSFGDSGIDLGDLKYLLQMIGALFGFGSGIPVPLNFIDAAWHFFSTYIFPASGFQDVIDLIIDGVIAFMLDLLGEVPIVGQAAEQLAVIISDIRDLLDPIAAAVDTFFAVFDINPTDPGSGDSITAIFGAFRPIWEAFSTALDGVVLPDFASVFHEIALWTLPFVNLIAEIITALAPLLTDLIDMGAGVFTPAIELLAVVIEDLAPILGIITAVVTALNPILAEITDVVSTLDPILADITALVSAGSGDLGPLIDAISTGFGGPTGLDTTGLFGFLSGLPSLSSPLDVASVPVISAISGPVFQPLVDLVSPNGGSGFPWNFPITFGGGSSTILDVGNVIANSADLAQQVLDTVVRTNTGATGSGFSLQQFETALQQQPGSFLISELPSEIIPLITHEMTSPDVQTSLTQTILNATDIANIVQYAEQNSPAALGTFIGSTGGIAQAAQTFVSGAVDTINTVLGGIPFVGSQLDDLFNQFTGFLTQTHNNWTGTNLPQASAPDVAAAAQNSATQANAQSQLIQAIQSQLPKFYGGGNNGLTYQTGFTGSLPAGFVAYVPGTGPCYNTCINTSEPAQTSTQAVSAIWTTSDNWGKCLIIRSNSTGVTMTYAKFDGNTWTIGCWVAGVNHILGSGSMTSGVVVANYDYQFEGVGRVLTLSGPGIVGGVVTDSGNISTINTNTKYGGFGTDGSIIQTAGWGSAGGFTFYPPAGLVNGDMYDIYGSGAGGGGGGGVGVWGNGGAGGTFAENSGIGTYGAGSFAGSTIIGNANAPAVGAPINIVVGGGGPPGSSEYYATGQNEYYWYGGSSGLSQNVAANYGSSGAAGDQSYASWSGGYVICPGGDGGGAYGNAPTGGAGWYGNTNSGWGLVNGSAPAYNGGNATEWGQGGTGCYSGTGQTYVTDWYDSFGNHFYGYQWGVNSAQTAGYGYSGVMFIDSVSRQLPGTIASFAFWDAAISGPQYVQVYPGSYTESCAGDNAWHDLASTNDQLTVNVGPSGMVAMFIASEFVYNTAANGQCFIGMTITGANNYGTSIFATSGTQTTIGADGQSADSLLGFFLLTGGVQGATTFKMKYLANAGVGGGTGNFGPRTMLAIPF